MMDIAASQEPGLVQIVLLAIIQGITEFLPISSSAHLILLPKFFQWPDQGLVIDVAVHVGTLAAVTLYFRRDFLDAARGGLDLLRGRMSEEARLALMLVLASLPVIAAGFGLNQLAPDGIRSAKVIAITTIGFGLMLFWVDRRFTGTGTMAALSWKSVFVIGLFQMLALLPGTSRSGITMTAGLLFGLSRAESARFSLLLSFPTIAGAGVLKSLDLIESGDAALGLNAVIAAALAFATALFAIAAMMAWLRRATFTPFVVYRVLLGVVIIFVLL